ncbi:MAG: hypothetical protein AAB819_00155 [Patescibacteria group bacterium]
MNPNEMNKSGAGATGSGGMGGAMPNTTPTMGGGDKNGKTGAIIGIIVIVIILIIGALYFWGERLVGTPNEEASQTETTPVFQPTESASSEITDIEADLSTTELNNLDAELESINTELGI